VGSGGGVLQRRRPKAAPVCLAPQALKLIWLRIVLRLLHSIMYAPR
jgi:hypothetical protein